MLSLLFRILLGVLMVICITSLAGYAMAVTPVLRLHVIGTSLVTFPEGLRRRMVDAALRRPFFNLELHGIDLADAARDGFPAALIARQPDLRRSLSSKRAALWATLQQVRAHGATFQTLAQMTVAPAV
jgi:hypothetical protein